MPDDKNKNEKDTMKNLFTMILFILLVITSGKISAQSDTTRWKPILVNDKQSTWYDVASIDTLQNNKVYVWVLQTHKPPLKFDGLRGDIYSSKTQYAIDFQTNKYGILKVIYYDNNNNEMYNFNYHIDKYADELKYTYPTVNYSVMKELVSILEKVNIK